MFATRWRNWLKAPTRSRRGGGSSSRRRIRRIPTAEGLEDRQLLAVTLVTNHGGSILQSVQVETVFWNWNTPALQAMATQLDTFVADITQSAYWNDLSQYGGVTYGSWSGEYDIAGAPPQTTLGYGGLAVTTNADVETTLTANLGQTDANGNTLPVPNPASTLYLVFMPPGDAFNFTDATATFPVAASYSGGGWSTFGGQHAWHNGAGGADPSYAYAVVPFPGPVGGGFSNIISPDATSVLNFLTVVSSHELVEAVTDAQAYVNANGTATAYGWYVTPPGAGANWTGGGQEIGDLCTGQNVWITVNNAVDPTIADSWYVQLYWSNFIPISTAPHDWPQSQAGASKPPSVFKPTPPGVNPPPRPKPPAQPPLPGTTSPTPPPQTGPSVPGGPSLIQTVIAASPTNPSDLAVASQNGLAISTNAGATWTPLIGSPSASGGQSSLVYNKTGSLFWSYVNPTTGGISIVTLNPATGAVTAGPFTVNAPPSGSTDVQQDLAADNPQGSPQSNNLAVVWTQLGPNGSSKILLSISSNQGKTWLTPTTVVASASGSPPTYYYGATVTLAPNGSIAVAYHAQPGYTVTANGGIVPNGTSGETLAAVYTYNASTQALTQRGPTITAFAAGQSDITFNDQQGSRTIAGTTFLTQGSVIPQILVNPTQPGLMYVVTVQDPAAGTSNPASSEVVMATLVQNSNGTWSSSSSTIAAPSSSGSFDLFPAASIGPTGEIVVTWYTNQNGQKNAAGHYLLDTYATYSVDGGLTWATPFQLDAQSFDPDAGAATVLSGPPATTGIGNSIGLAIDGATVFVANGANTFTGSTATGQQVAVESFALSGQLVVVTGLGNNVITIRRSSSGSDVDQVLVNNVVVANTPIVSLAGGILISAGLDLDSGEGGTSANVQNDTLILDYSNGDPVPSGGVDFDGPEGGSNVIEVNADASYTLSDSSLTIVGASGTDTVTLDNVGSAQLTGGPSNDTFTLSSWSGSTTITGGTGTNALVVAAGMVKSSTLKVSHVQTLSVTGGTLDVNASFSSIPTVGVQGMGILELDNGVTLTANVTNAGTLTLGGSQIASATISGNYTQTSAGSLDIKLGGAAAGQYDQLQVTGNTALSGTLNVSLVNNFMPTQGQSFQIITFMGTLSGDFTTENFPTLGGGNTFKTSSGSGSYTLTVTT